MSAVDARLAALEARLAAVEARLSGGPAAAGNLAVADDDDLDSDYGNPVIKGDPRRWLEDGGDSFIGCKMSECPSDYLRMLASLFDWQAAKDEAQNKTYTNKRTGKEQATAPFKRKDAARARGWAKRNAGRASGPSVASAGRESLGATGSDDEIPF